MLDILKIFEQAVKQNTTIKKYVRDVFIEGVPVWPDWVKFPCISIKDGSSKYFYTELKNRQQDRNGGWLPIQTNLVQTVYVSVWQEVPGRNPSKAIVGDRDDIGLLDLTYTVIQTIVSPPMLDIPNLIYLVVAKVSDSTAVEIQSVGKKVLSKAITFELAQNKEV